MKRCNYNPTLAETLSDPIVRALMRADGVDPRELEERLGDVARQAGLRAPRQASAIQSC